jgi:Outer membrane receptor proteins, mostly Fe transport
MHIELFRFHANGTRGMLGQWSFSTLDALAAGDPDSYKISKDFGSAEARVQGTQPSGYVSDEWRINDRLSLTLGLRGDVLNYSSRPRYNASVDSVFDRNTSDYPRARFEWSPRFGFVWKPTTDHAAEVRGGAGLFVGPPPLGWMLGPVRSNGAGVRSLSCVGRGKVPKFVADPGNQPQVCPDGTGFTAGPVALVDRDLRMARSFRTSLAIDRRIFWSLDAGVEALYSRVLSDYLFVNANLKGPQSVDAHGRVLYGKIDANGKSTPALVGDGFPEVIDLRNHSLGYSWSGTVQLEKQFRNHLGMRASYTYSRSRDVQSLTNTSAVAPLDIWASGRQLSGRHDELITGISAFDIPHRVVLIATYSAPWRRWKTDFSLYYIGESGTPFTFGDSTSGGKGDLNADGTSLNDPIYVPLDATDQREIVFDGPNSAAQGAAFEQFIRNTPCLRRQRGRIVERNSCSGPWVNTSNGSVRQSLQTIRGHDLSLQVEVFNLLNMFDSSWGLFKQPYPWILQHIGQTAGNPSQPVFHFDTTFSPTNIRNLESGYQLQLSLRYNF